MHKSDDLPYNSRFPFFNCFLYLLMEQKKSTQKTQPAAEMLHSTYFPYTVLMGQVAMKWHKLQKCISRIFSIIMKIEEAALCRGFNDRSTKMAGAFTNPGS